MFLNNLYLWHIIVSIMISCTVISKRCKKDIAICRKKIGGNGYAQVLDAHSKAHALCAYYYNCQCPISVNVSRYTASIQIKKICPFFAPLIWRHFALRYVFYIL